ncbi:hypothetical protein [Gemmatimonas sp.]|uniref:hypothetical protein n=1 Tax=Gemmatimonas sp. TaxID=1962908 RepID=UPI00286D5203|nr:hypothetical protein [Gemmatimonas sp.]
MSAFSGSALRESMQMVGIGLGVTVIGLIVGAVVVSPAVSHEQRLLGIGSLFGIAAVVLAARLVIRGLRARPTKTTRQARHTPAPTITLRSGKSSRTPRAVAALAAAGADPTEIAWKTGLPVDAVSMLLEISGSRMSAV